MENLTRDTYIELLGGENNDKLKIARYLRGSKQVDIQMLKYDETTQKPTGILTPCDVIYNSNVRKRVSRGLVRPLLPSIFSRPPSNVQVGDNIEAREESYFIVRKVPRILGNGMVSVEHRKGNKEYLRKDSRTHAKFKRGGWMNLTHHPD